MQTEQSISSDTFHNLVKPEMVQVNTVICDALSSDVLLINQLGNHIIHSGGKRLRPVLSLLSAKCFGELNHSHNLLAAIIEFIHTATLLHDDVVDASEQRRGKQSANQIWGNEASVLVGDFLYSRSFQLMVKLNNMAVMSILANTTNTLAAGEVMQLQNCHNPEVTEQDYRQVINAKTASLFSAAAEAGGMISGANDSQCQALSDYGRHLGLCYQLVDDALDYDADPAVLGKNIGDDLLEGKPTLPLIHALKNSDEKQQAAIRTAIKTGGLDNFTEINQAIVDTKAIEYTYQSAKTESARAISALDTIPESEYKTALIQLAEFAVQRKY